MKVNCLIVDDEPSSIKLVKTYLERFDEYVVVGEANDAVEALRLIENNNLDLIFLDIKMPGLSGIELLKSLFNPPKVIIISGHPEYAIDCYELNVIDYLLKPISIERFLKALNKYKSKSNNHNNHKPLNNNYLNHSNFLKLKPKSKTYNIRLDNIVYIESMREFIKIHYNDGDTIVLKYVLSKLEEVLPNRNFVRIHKSYIVSIEKIRSFSNKYIEISDKKIPIGSIYKNHALKCIASC